MRNTIILLLVILILIPSVVGFGQITGHFTSAYEGDDIIINTQVEEPFSLEYDLEDGAMLSSVRLYGSVEGDGNVQVFAGDNGGHKFLIVSYNYRKRSGFSGIITGFLSNIGDSLTGAVIKENDYEPSRYLDGVCSNTCNLQGQFEGNKLRISVEIEPGTKLNLYKIYYQTYGSKEQKLDAPDRSFLARLWDSIFG